MITHRATLMNIHALPDWLFGGEEYVLKDHLEYPPVDANDNSNNIPQDVLVLKIHGNCEV